MLPEHCIIDNDNHLTIDDVDKNYTPGTDTTSRVTPHDEWSDEYKPYED